MLRPPARPSFLRVTLRVGLLASGLACAAVAAAQDPVFSQFYAAPLLLNPAFAGTTYAPHVALNHRSQNVGFAGGIPYQTYAASYGQYVAPIRSGIGLSLTGDDAGQGLIASYAALAHYAYQVRVDDRRSIRLGLSAGAQHRRLDWDRLVFFDQLDAETGASNGSGGVNPTREQRPAETSVTFADFGAGLLYAGPLAYAGLSLNHITTPDDRLANLGPGGFYRGLPMRWSVHAGLQIPFGSGVGRGSTRGFATPSILYARQGPAEQLNVGAYATTGLVFGGLWYRHAFGNADAAIAVVGVEFQMYKLGYSYDLSVGPFAGAAGGSHELSLQVNFDRAWWVERRRSEQRYTDCLGLFR